MDGRANLKLPRGLYDRLRAVAAERGGTAPRLAAIAIEEWLERVAGELEAVNAVHNQRVEMAERAMVPAVSVQSTARDLEREREGEGFNQEKEW